MTVCPRCDLSHRACTQATTRYFTSLANLFKAGLASVWHSLHNDLWTCSLTQFIRRKERERPWERDRKREWVRDIKTQRTKKN